MVLHDDGVRQMREALATQCKDLFGGTTLRGTQGGIEAPATWVPTVGKVIQSVLVRCNTNVACALGRKQRQLFFPSQTSA